MGHVLDHSFTTLSSMIVSTVDIKFEFLFEPQLAMVEKTSISNG